MEEVNDLTDIEEDEFLRRRMVLGSVFILRGMVGGIRDRTACTAMSSFQCSSTGMRHEAIFSLGRAGALPSI